MRELSAQLTEEEKSRNPEGKLLGGFYITVGADIIRPQKKANLSVRLFYYLV